MKLYHKNPREITGKQFSDLGEWLEELGDLSGIVHNLPTDEVISGNQRFRVFSLDELEIVITEEFDEPDKQGTLKRGYAIWRGGKYNYRAVVWTPEQCEKASIVANKAGGKFDFDILANEFDVDDLLNWGFKGWELGIDSEVDYEKEWEGMPEFEQENAGPIKTIKVHFATQDDIKAFAEYVEQPITDKTIYIWYPKKDRMNLLALACEDES